MAVLTVSSRLRAARRRGRGFAFGALVAVIVVWSLFPSLWQSISSFQPDRDLTDASPKWLPFPGGTLQPYRNVFGPITSGSTS